MEEFILYLNRNWFGRTPVFRKELWNHYENRGPRTNNLVKGYNNKLKKYISSRLHIEVYLGNKKLICEWHKLVNLKYIRFKMEIITVNKYTNKDMFKNSSANKTLTINTQKFVKRSVKYF